MILNSLTIPGHIIFEAGEGHRWQFDYENYQTDPKPDVLVLGTYKHPTTGNQLVGGINLHYISKRDQLDLRKLLPELSKIRGLKKRYRFGARALPHIFSDQAYRTYDSDHIADLKTGVLFPVYGVLSKDAEKVTKAKANKAAQLRAAPQVVDANKDIRNVEKAYEKETAKIARDVPSDKSIATQQDKEITDRYAQIKVKDANLKHKEAEQLKAEKEYADTIDNEVIKAAPSIAPAPVGPTLTKPVATAPVRPVTSAPVKPAVPTPAKPITPAPVTQAKPAQVAVKPAVPVQPVIKAPNIDYTKTPNYDDRIEKAPIRSEFNDLPIVDEGKIMQKDMITEAGKRTITYYSPRLQRYIIEAL
jgi:hypothetical protein